MDKKRNIRSFRYNDKIAQILNDSEGKNFNEKFENLIYKSQIELSEKQAEVKRYEKMIADKQNDYYKLCSKLREVDDLLETLRNVKRYGEAAAKKAKLIIEE